MTVTARRKGCFNFLCSATATPGCSVEFYPSMQHFQLRKWGDVRSHSTATRGVANCGGFYGVFKKGGYGKQSD